MKVSLISYTGHGVVDALYAAKLLVFTKNTRLQMTPDGMEAINLWSMEKLRQELEYMSGTIPSSWEFVDLIFSVEGVSRACAQQMTRTRVASFAMQSQRVTDMSDVKFYVPSTVPANLVDKFKHALGMTRAFYSELVDNGCSFEDARGVLAINAECNLLVKYNLRAFVELMRSRQSLRAQGEYRDIAGAMKAECLKVWPWTETFFEPKMAKAIRMIEEVAASLTADLKAKLAKAADLLKK